MIHKSIFSFLSQLIAAVFRRWQGYHRKFLWERIGRFWSAGMLQKAACEVIRIKESE